MFQIGPHVSTSEINSRLGGLKVIDAAMQNRIAAAKQLAQQVSRKREAPHKRVVRYIEKENKVLRFNSRNAFQEAATAVEVFADLKGQPVEIASSLSGYLDREERIYLLPSELALFSPEGRVIVKGVLFEIKAESLIATIIATGEIVQYPLAMNAYIENSAEADQDPVHELLVPPPPCEIDPTNCDGGGGGGGGGDGDPPSPNPTPLWSNIMYSVWSPSAQQYYDLRVLQKIMRIRQALPHLEIGHMLIHILNSGIMAKQLLFLLDLISFPKCMLKPC